MQGNNGVKVCMTRDTWKMMVHVGKDYPFGLGVRINGDNNAFNCRCRRENMTTKIRTLMKRKEYIMTKQDGRQKYKLREQKKMQKESKGELLDVNRRTKGKGILKRKETRTNKDEVMKKMTQENGNEE